MGVTTVNGQRAEGGQPATNDPLSANELAHLFSLHLMDREDGGEVEYIELDFSAWILLGKKCHYFPCLCVSMLCFLSPHCVCLWPAESESFYSGQLALQTDGPIGRRD